MASFDALIDDLGFACTRPAGALESHGDDFSSLRHPLDEEINHDDGGGQWQCPNQTRRYRLSAAGLRQRARLEHVTHGVCPALSHIPRGSKHLTASVVRITTAAKGVAAGPARPSTRLLKCMTGAKQAMVKGS